MQTKQNISVHIHMYGTCLNIKRKKKFDKEAFDNELIYT